MSKLRRTFSRSQSGGLPCYAFSIAFSACETRDTLEGNLGCPRRGSHMPLKGISGAKKGIWDALDGDLGFDEGASIGLGRVYVMPSVFACEGRQPARIPHSPLRLHIEGNPKQRGRHAFSNAVVVLRSRVPGAIGETQESLRAKSFELGQGVRGSPRRGPRGRAPGRGFQRVPTDPLAGCGRRTPTRNNE